MNERSFLRLIADETGMSFGRWHQQLGVVLAVKSLAAGAMMQRVAADLGYESVLSFVIMAGKAWAPRPTATWPSVICTDMCIRVALGTVLSGGE